MCVCEFLLVLVLGVEVCFVFSLIARCSKRKGRARGGIGPGFAMDISTFQDGNGRSGRRDCPCFLIFAEFSDGLQKRRFWRIHDTNGPGNFVSFAEWWIITPIFLASMKLVDMISLLLLLHSCR